MVKLKTTDFLESIFVCENTSSKISLESKDKSFSNPIRINHYCVRLL